ncbi:MAG TPA: hypothetical protein VFP72_13660 [Kineosporiaceae bacterium]|nr:hypothetical protein [Kineosporiaceae bacterium]
MFAPDPQTNAFVLAGQAFSSLLLQWIRLLWWGLVASFAVAGCGYCGYLSYVSWSRMMESLREGHEPALDPGDESSVTRYAAAGIRELERYLTTRAPADPQEPSRGTRRSRDRSRPADDR